MSNIPALGGNWVDLIVIVILLFYMLDGVRRGFILGILDLLGFVLSFAAALKFYDFGANLLIANFSLPLGIANAAGFLLIGFLFEVFFTIILRFLVRSIPDKIIASKIDKLFGILPAIGNTAIISAFLLTLFITLPIKGSIKSAIFASKLGSPLVSKTQGLEKEINKIFGDAIEESLTFLTVQPQSSETVDLNFTQKQLTVDTQAEREMLILVNRERQSRGLAALEFAEDSLQEIARAHAKDMFERGYFSHYTPEGKSPFDRMKEAGISYLAAGENLALAPNLTLAHQGLMNSPGHRANILSPDYNRIGIGVIDGGIYGKMFVQEFTD